ncbi:aromatic amino acid aminotransferase gamma [Fructobacillus pseudoficulneus]|uniref:Aminotransferase n=1 Tax=Fructobacillus pseudoficulneus TaxID=220714 RepID=A0A3F3H3E2_9LACO|nr:aminotransferase class I/II-fold pyridoxal phosphate-dependent enzyme [Fructobacillus pseudoficulneus]GAP02620.1 aromatic amino acid aminotransferase gamma [Fructobacillus pseudoficulneus]SEH38613.1 aminotransferase [Fructobacillus pseudoficulneus]
MTKPLNPSVLNLTPDKLLSFQHAVANIEGLVSLTFGEPGFATPDVIKEATIDSIRSNRSHYGDSQGEPALRQAVLDYMKDRYDLDYPSIDNVVVTVGVTEAMQSIFKTLLASGDGLLIPDPAYGSYFSALSLAGGTAVPINTEANAYKLTPAMVNQALAEATVPVKGILFNYPSNPTGVTYNEAELAELAQCFEENDLWVISDEIYAELTYDGDHFSMGKLLPDRTIVVNGLSKSHAMTGYRLGFILGPLDLMAEIQKVHGPLVFAVPTFIQDGATAALKIPKADLAYMIEGYRERRDYAVKFLEDLGFELVAPQGAFYLFAKLPADFGTDGWSFAEKLAQEAKVSVIPGAGFSLFESANQFIRISYASEMSQLQEGLKRIATYVEQQRQK